MEHIFTKFIDDYWPSIRLNNGLIRGKTYMKQDSEGLPELVPEKSAEVLNILVYDKNPADRWLIGIYIRQITDRVIILEETNDISEAKKILNQGKIDLFILDFELEDEFRYWLTHIIEERSVALIILTESDSEVEFTRSIPDSPVICLPINTLSRDELIQTIESVMRKWQSIKRNEAHKDELERLANFDVGTGLLNRRTISYRLDECMARARRYEEELSVLLLDVDYFKQINEKLGWEGGNLVLKRIATLLQRKIRDADFIGRYGGDEFLIVFPHTNYESARIAAERIRTLIESLALVLEDKQKETINLTVSGGLATYQPGDDITKLTYRAERCLCQAKEEGRNRVIK
jgi:diguanylate cyclase (GGDEF)-like protein